MNELNFALFFIFSKYSYREVAPALWQFEVNVQTKKKKNEIDKLGKGRKWVKERGYEKVGKV